MRLRVLMRLVATTTELPEPLRNQRLMMWWRSADNSVVLLAMKTVVLSQCAVGLGSQAREE